MAHHLDRPIDAGLSYERLQHERDLLKLQSSSPDESFNNTRCSLKVISGYNPRLFIADPDMDDVEREGNR